MTIHRPYLWHHRSQHLTIQRTLDQWWKKSISAVGEYHCDIHPENALESEFVTLFLNRGAPFCVRLLLDDLHETCFLIELGGLR